MAGVASVFPSPGCLERIRVGLVNESPLGRVSAPVPTVLRSHSRIENGGTILKVRELRCSFAILRRQDARVRRTNTFDLYLRASSEHPFVPDFTTHCSL